MRLPATPKSRRRQATQVLSDDPSPVQGLRHTAGRHMCATAATHIFMWCFWTASTVKTALSSPGNRSAICRRVRWVTCSSVRCDGWRDAFVAEAHSPPKVASPLATITMKTMASKGSQRRPSPARRLPPDRSGYVASRTLAFDKPLCASLDGFTLHVPPLARVAAPAPAPAPQRPPGWETCWAAAAEGSRSHHDAAARLNRRTGEPTCLVAHDERDHVLGLSTPSGIEYLWWHPGHDTHP
jgi:hypothetical protein